MFVSVNERQSLYLSVMLYTVELYYTHVSSFCVHMIHSAVKINNSPSGAKHGCVTKDDLECSADLKKKIISEFALKTCFSLVCCKIRSKVEKKF